MEKVRLGDIATYINGYAFKPTDWSDIGIPIVRIQDLTGNSYQLNRYEGNYDKKYEVNYGDILISWSASLGVYIWKGEKAVLNQHIFKVEFDKVNVNKQFFLHQVGEILEKSAGEAHGATMKHLTKKVFDSLPFYLPAEEKQLEIANVLDKLTDLINKRKQQLQKLDELVKARFVDMFGDPELNPMKWTIKSFGELTDIITDGEHSTPKRVDKGIYLLSARNILNHSFQLDDVDYIDEEEYNRIAKRIIPRCGDVLISCSGSVGRCCIVPKKMKFQMVRSVALVRFKDNINPVFAEHMITSDYLQNQIDSSKSESAQANLFQGKIAKLKGFAPPIEIQNNFASFVKQVDKSKSAVKKSLEKLELLKKSLMQEYFG